jgi:hypothetical protein
VFGAKISLFNSADQDSVARVKRTVLIRLLWLTLAFSLTASNAFGFALLGPYADWMDTTNGFRMPGDIGGPMDIKEGYRWNVPTVTYGFDQSFLDYFGSNGVYAVESAIGILNALPPASELFLTNFPFSTTRGNGRAAASGLLDLKSVALFTLLEELGLTQPIRYIFAIRRWDPSLVPYENGGVTLGSAPNYLIERNFAPESLQASVYINGTLYAGLVWTQDTNPVPTSATVVVVDVDPTADYSTAVADGWYGYFSAGKFFIGLTFDDVGGLRYLLSTNNLAFETLLPGVQPSVSSANPLVNGAIRPGVDKLTFVRHPFDSQKGAFLTITNPYLDTYVQNGQVQHQQLQRVLDHPDFLFAAGNNGWPGSLAARTDTKSWINNAAATGNSGGTGPGVITPPVVITFDWHGDEVQTLEPTPETSVYVNAMGWGTFDGTTNALISYPTQSATNANPLVVRFLLWSALSPRSQPTTLLQTFKWQLPIPYGGTALLQTSTNLMDWVSVCTTTNKGSAVDWQHGGVLLSQRFFRVIPQ